MVRVDKQKTFIIDVFISSLSSFLFLMKIKKKIDGYSMSGSIAGRRRGCAEKGSGDIHILFRDNEGCRSGNIGNSTKKNIDLLLG